MCESDEQRALIKLGKISHSIFTRAERLIYCLNGNTKKPCHKMEEMYRSFKKQSRSLSSHKTYSSTNWIDTTTQNTSRMMVTRTHYIISMLLLSSALIFSSASARPSGPRRGRNRGSGGGGRSGRGGDDNDPIELTAVRSIDGSQEDVRAQAGAMLLRLAASDYPDGDGAGTMINLEPNPRLISNLVADNDVEVLAESASDMLWIWGQFVDHDMSLTHFSGEANDYVPITSPDCDADIMCTIPFTRSEHTMLAGNREHTNTITSFIDASMVYGSDRIRADALREFEGGRLKVSENGLLLPFNDQAAPLPNDDLGGNDPSRVFLAGDVRANEQIGLTTMHTLFVREHNRIVARLDRTFRNSTDEALYQMGRKIVGAEIQRITYNEFLPQLLGPTYAPKLEDYTGYDSTVNPAIATEFSTVAFRVGHTMLSPTFFVGESDGSPTTLSLGDAFFNPDILIESPTTLDSLLSGFCVQSAQQIDTKVIDEVRNFLFGLPDAGVGHDLVSLNIQRGRDHGIPKYTALRAALNLTPVTTSFADITNDVNVQQSLSDAYNGNVDLVDAWIGGLAEEHVPGGMVGELFATIISDQFRRLMVGDPFFYLNDVDLQQGGVEGEGEDNDNDNRDRSSSIASQVRRHVIDVNRVRLSYILAKNTDGVPIDCRDNAMRTTTTDDNGGEDNGMASRV